MKTCKPATVACTFLLFICSSLFSDWNKPYLPAPEGTPNNPRNKIYSGKRVKGGSRVDNVKHPKSTLRDDESTLTQPDTLYAIMPGDSLPDPSSPEYSQIVAGQLLGLAQVSLGKKYESGDGVSPDYREAFRWFHLAAMKGIPEASYKLGCLYSEGKGVNQNYFIAYQWLYLACSAHPAGNAEYSKKLAETGIQLSPEQIIQAQTQAPALLKP